MTTPSTLKEEIQEVRRQVRHFLEERHRRRDVTHLNTMIRNLRISVQGLLLNYFIHMGLEESERFCNAFHDQLLGACGEAKDADHEYHQYYVQAIMTTFEWAHQIKSEIHDDPVTQRVLIIDIPILRPFDYGLKKSPHRKV